MSRRKIDSKQLGAQLKEWREAMGLFQREIAEILHVSTETIQGWESGRRTPILDDLDSYLRVVRRTMTFGRDDAA